MTRKVLAPFAPGAGSQQVTSGLLWQVRGCWMTKITKDIVVAIYIVDFSDRRLGKLRKHLRRLKRPSGDLGSAWVVQLFQNNTLDWMILTKASNLIQFSSWKRPPGWVCKDANRTITRRLKQALSNASLYPPRVRQTRGRTNRLDGQIVRHLSVWCEFNLCRTVVDLFVSTDNRLSRQPNIRRFARQKIYSSRLSETICPFRRFPRPLVWKWPLSLENCLTG